MAQATLTPDEVEQFYGIWFPLLHFVNEQRGVVNGFPAHWGAGSVSPQKAVKVAEALWRDDRLLHAFVEQNPAGLSPDDLAIAASWTYHVTGTFFVLRYLKKYAVFLAEDSPPRAYGVLGLASHIEDVVPLPPPAYVQATLLPFGDRIIYDGLLAAYPVILGGGIRANLNDTYRRVQETTGIITSLQPHSVESPREHKARHKKVLAAFQRELGRAGLSPKMVSQHVANIDALAQSERFSGNAPRSLLDLDSNDVDAYLREPGANLVSLKRFITFLRDTDRLDYGEALALLNRMK